MKIYFGCNLTSIFNLKTQDSDSESDDDSKTVGQARTPEKPVHPKAILSQKSRQDQLQELVRALLLMSTTNMSHRYLFSDAFGPWFAYRNPLRSNERGDPQCRHRNPK